MATKTQKNLRISQLTLNQLATLADKFDFSATEAITLAVDRLHHDLLAKPCAFPLAAVRHFTSRMHQLEAASVADWPQWSAQDLEFIEHLLRAIQLQEVIDN